MNSEKAFINDSNNHYMPINLINPSFDSKLTTLIIDLNHLRKRKLMGSTHPIIFFQLKHLFHTLESIGSARIEGNNTTIAEYIATKLDDSTSSEVSENILEIQNMERTMSFIDDVIKEHPIDRAFVSELHKKVVDGLSIGKEGDKTPGQYRSGEVKINKSAHIPPMASTVHSYMDELLTFINEGHEPKYDLLKIAIAHHRFAWVHPFSNGNGRTVRLLTYAMLVKSGFNVNSGRILNPTAVFCSNRENYYNYLSGADSGTENGMLSWCEYVLEGLHREIEKIDRLLNHEYLKNNILYPAIDDAVIQALITDQEAQIMKKAADLQVIKAGDLKGVVPHRNAVDITRALNKLKEKKLLASIAELSGNHEKSERHYAICFNSKFLIRSIIKVLDKGGFLPVKD